MFCFLGFTGCGLIDSKSSKEPAPVSTFFLDVENPTWSPDGTKILYTDNGFTSITRDLQNWTEDIDSMGVRIMDSNGKSGRKIFDFAYAELSPNGDNILLVINYAIFKANFNGSEIDTSSFEQLTFEGASFSPEWSPDGKYLIYEQLNCAEDQLICGLWLLDLTTNTHQLISEGATDGTWSWDNNRVLFVKNSSSGSVFYEYNLSTRSERVIHEMDGKSYNLDLSPVDDLLVFESGVRGEIRNIWKLDLVTNDLSKLTSEWTIMPDWSPDGTKIVYVAGGIWVMNSDGSNKENIKPLPYID
jgi:Tol biopolymer transport system component